jgi:hypothetical protein
MRYATFLRSALLSSAAIVVMQGSGHRSWAQSLPTCDPPQANEYLLLVVNQQAETEDQLRQLLPDNAVLTNCQYLNDPVVRVGGFATAEIANAWAQYLADMTGLQAFVARPSTAAPDTSATPTEPTPSSTSFPSPTQPTASGGTSSPVPETTSQTPPADRNPNAFPTPTEVPGTPEPSPESTPESTPEPSPTNAVAPAADRTTGAFNPQPLGAGYAVLVYYFNRPEVAADVRQLTAQPVGLVSYEQRPFLLATHTTDPTAAATVLQSLNEQGFRAILVDSRGAILLTPAVVGTESEG